MYSFVPYEETKEGAELTAQASEQTPAIVRIKTANEVLWRAISDWVNGDALKPEALKQFKEKVSSTSRVTYPKHIN